MKKNNMNLFKLFKKKEKIETIEREFDRPDEIQDNILKNIRYSKDGVKYGTITGIDSQGNILETEVRMLF